ncbi:MAG: ABC transporter ATP-binding protein [Phycisphaerales bacterium]
MSTPTHHAMTIAGLKFRYGGDAASPWVVNVPSLSLARGEQALVVGRSGRGKSTLLQIIAGLMRPTEGRVEIGGTDLHAMGEGARDQFRGRSIGMVFQTLNLLQGFSAAENVMAALMFGAVPAREHRARAESLLRRLGVERPDSLAEELSVGQQQRVAVARAVACDPVLVLADEPTASLDPENAGVAMDLLQQSCREKNAALLCVSHDPAMSARFARRTSLDELAGMVPAAVGGQG